MADSVSGGELSNCSNPRIDSEEAGKGGCGNQKSERASSRTYLSSAPASELVSLMK